jgi:hypothetical protein
MLIRRHATDDDGEFTEGAVGMSFDPSRNLDHLAPSARFLARITEAALHAKMDAVPPEKVAQYLRDLAQDVVETNSK